MSDRISPHPAKIYESGEWPSLAKAPVLGTGDREFESPLPDNYISATSGAATSPPLAERSTQEVNPRYGGGLLLFVGCPRYVDLAANDAGAGRGSRWNR